MDNLLHWLAISGPEYLRAAAWTAGVAAAAAIGSLIGGSLLFFVYWMSGKGGRRAVDAYVQLFRNTPVLLPIYLLYFGLPVIGLPWPAVVCGALAIVLQSSAYVSEILRGSFNAIERIQLDAARSLGLSRWDTFRRAILPQIVVHSLPALGNQVVLLMKDTSLLSAITVFDLVMNAKLLTETTGMPYTPFLITAGIYLVLVWGIDAAFRSTQRRVKWR